MNIIFTLPLKLRKFHNKTNLNNSKFLSSILHVRLIFLTICMLSFTIQPFFYVQSTTSTISNSENNSNLNLSYSTFIGGSDSETFYGRKSITVDSQGNSYIIGSTNSDNFPTINAYNDTFGGSDDVFIAKFDSLGNPVFSTFFGGSGNDEGYGIAVDKLGNIFVTGSTQSTNFPLKNAYNKTYGGSNDVFIAKFDPSGKLIYSTYIGGLNSDIPNNIVVDNFDDCYISGITYSANFPMLHAYNSTFGGVSDAFVAKFDPSGYLMFSTFIGGQYSDEARGLVIDNNSNIYVTGTTFSANFPIKNAYDNTLKGIQDAFLLEINGSTHSLVFSTFLGGNNLDESHSIVIDDNNSVYLVGDTRSNDFPMKNAYNNTYGGNTDTFVTKFSFNGSLLYSTYLGSSGTDDGYAIAIDNNKNIYITGSTSSNNFPLKNPYNGTYGGNVDVYLSELNSTGSLLFSTYIGGNMYDVGYGIALDYNENLIVIGTTSSNSFPLKNSFRSIVTGSNDAFIIKFGSANSVVSSSITSEKTNTTTTPILTSTNQIESQTNTNSDTNISLFDLSAFSNPVIMGIVVLFFLSLVLNLILLRRKKSN